MDHSDGRNIAIFIPIIEGAIGVFESGLDTDGNRIKWGLGYKGRRRLL